MVKWFFSSRNIKRELEASKIIVIHLSVIVPINLFVFIVLAKNIEAREFQATRRSECIQRRALCRNSEDYESVQGNVSVSSNLVADIMRCLH